MPPRRSVRSTPLSSQIARLPAVIAPGTSVLRVVAIEQADPMAESAVPVQGTTTLRLESTVVPAALPVLDRSVIRTLYSSISVLRKSESTPLPLPAQLPAPRNRAQRTSVIDTVSSASAGDTAFTLTKPSWLDALPFTCGSPTVSSIDAALGGAQLA